MSFILDALKKSESDRQRQSGPALFEVKVAPPKSRFPVWAIAIGALLAINMIIVGWMLLRRGSHTEDATAANTSPASTNSAGTGPGANGMSAANMSGGGAYPGGGNYSGGAGGQPGNGGGAYTGGQGGGQYSGNTFQGNAQPGNGNMSGNGGAYPNGGPSNGGAYPNGGPSNGGAYPNGGQNGGGYAAGPGGGTYSNGPAGQPNNGGAFDGGQNGGGAFNGRQPGGQFPGNTFQGNAQPGNGNMSGNGGAYPNGGGMSARGQNGPTLAGAGGESGEANTESSANPDDYAPAADPGSSVFKGHVKRGTESGFVLYQDAALVPGANLPQLRLDLHVYAAKPQDRFALINMHKMHEGDALQDGVRVESITPDGVVMSHNGSKFLLPRE